MSMSYTLVPLVLSKLVNGCAIGHLWLHSLSDASKSKSWYTELPGADGKIFLHLLILACLSAASF